MAHTAVEEPPASPVGVVLAGVALAAALLVATRGVVTALPIGAVGIAAAAVALGAFLTRRHRLTSRRVGAPLALVGSVTVLGFAGYVLTSGDAGPVVAGVSVAALGGGLGAVAGLGGAVAAGVDAAAVPRGRFRYLSKVSAKYFGLGVLGVLAQIPVFLLIGVPLSAAVGGLSQTAETAVATVSGGIGMLAVTVFYLRRSERDFSFIDLRWPSLRDAGYAVGGVFAIFAASILVSVLQSALGATSSEHAIVQQASDGNAEILLVLVPLSLLVVGPGEELLYRNIVQKGLYEHFSKAGALLVASVIFALAHFTAYWSTDPVAFLSSLAAVFALSLVLGVIYIRTESVVVPAFVHGTFNAVSFLATYARIQNESQEAVVVALSLLGL